MEIKPLKIVRFTKLLEESGKPEPVTLWTAPENDRGFSKAMREGRVLTVVQSNVGTQSDYGLVGFHKEPLATYLIFPKKLAHSASTKVVGIKYEQLAEPKPRAPLLKPKQQGPPGVRMREQVTPHVHESERKTTEAEDGPGKRPEPEREQPKPPPPPPKLHRIRGSVEITFRQVIPVEVEAATAKEAARLIKEQTKQIQPDLASATLKKRARKPKKV